jgi:hypothetical protein
MKRNDFQFKYKMMRLKRKCLESDCSAKHVCCLYNIEDYNIYSLFFDIPEYITYCTNNIIEKEEEILILELSKRYKFNQLKWYEKIKFLFDKFILNTNPLLLFMIILIGLSLLLFLGTITIVDNFLYPIGSVCLLILEYGILKYYEKIKNKTYNT